MASDHEFGGPGVTKPHPKKNWVNPDAKQVHFASNEAPKKARGAGKERGAGKARGAGKERSGRSFLGRLRRRSG